MFTKPFSLEQPLDQIHDDDIGAAALWLQKTAVEHLGKSKYAESLKAPPAQTEPIALRPLTEEVFLTYFLNTALQFPQKIGAKARVVDAGRPTLWESLQKAHRISGDVVLPMIKAYETGCRDTFTTAVDRFSRQTAGRVGAAMNILEHRSEKPFAALLPGKN